MNKIEIVSFPPKYISSTSFLFFLILSTPTPFSKPPNPESQAYHFHFTCSLPTPQLTCCPTPVTLAFKYVGNMSPSLCPYNSSSFTFSSFFHLEKCISLFLNWLHCLYSHLPIIHFPQNLPCNHFKLCLPYLNFLKAPMAYSDDLQSRVWISQACKKRFLP